MQPSERQLIDDQTDRAKALANTYAELDAHMGCDRVQVYQRVLEWRGTHPNAGSQAAATAPGLPRSRIRPSFDGTKPDPVHAVDTAKTNGWLDTQPRERTFEALSVLTAWIFAGGSIARQSWAPLFAVGLDDPQRLAETALKAVSTTVRVERTDEPGRATELHPRPQASHPDRYLHVIKGVSLGPKNDYAESRQVQWLE